MHVLLDSLRNGLRFAKRGPAITAVAVIILALGIGAATGVFSILYAVSYRPLPYEKPDQLVVLLRAQLATMTIAGRAVTAASPVPMVPGPDFLNWEKHANVFSALAAALPYVGELEGGGRKGQIEGYEVTPGFFDVLGTKAVAGRLFTADDEQRGRDHVVVLGPGFANHGTWTSTVKVGGTLTLNKQEYAVVGSLPASFRVANASMLFMFPRPDVFLPIPVAQLERVPPVGAPKPGGMFAVIGRLKAGAGIAQAQTETTALTARLAKANPALDAGVSIQVKSMKSQVGQLPGDFLKMLIAGAVFLLLIACVNIGVLTLTQGARRQREIAIRCALGATRGRVVGQLFSESLLLATAGGAFGILVAFWVKRGLVSRIPPVVLPLTGPVEINGQVLLFALAGSALAAVLFGMIPALQLSLAPFAELLKEAARGGGAGVRSGWLRNAFVVCEVTLAFALLIVCGLLIGGIRGVLHSHSSYNPKHMLEMSVALAPGSYTSFASRESVYRRVLARIDGLHLVESAALEAEGMPGSVTAADTPVTALAFKTGPQAFVSFVSPDYFRTKRIPLLRGRAFTWADYAEKPAVAVVSQTLAHTLWPNQSPIGKHVTVTFPSQPLEVIGVAADESTFASVAFTMPHVYLPQLPLRAALDVQTTGKAKDALGLVHDLAADGGPGVQVSAPRTMEQVRTEASKPVHFIEFVLGFFGLMALLLATVGVFAVTAYSVTQRTHEIGVRVALGARPTQVLFALMRESTKLSMYGVCIGLLVALMLGKVLMYFRIGFGLGALSTYFGVALLLLAVAVLASYLAARRATKVDPIAALRCE